MASLSSQALRTVVFNDVIADAAFRAELAKDPSRAVEAKFGKQELAMRVITENENEMSFLIPEKTEQLAQSFARIVADVGERSPTRGEFEVMVVNKAWNDPAFMAELRSDPRVAIASVLQKFGAVVPERTTVHLYEERKGECVVVIPRPVDASAELSEAELEAVAGGEAIIIAITITGAVVGGIVTVIAEKIIPDMSSAS
jgi:hypothetical protein